ncbi:MAG: hypothetical protein ABIC68_00265 [Candidatus Omnitrophota bacterium]
MPCSKTSPAKKTQFSHNFFTALEKALFRKLQRTDRKNPLQLFIKNPKSLATHTNVWYSSFMFNHEARWDRELPAQSETESGSPITVSCVIEKGRILPKSFLWRKHKFTVEKVNFFWKDKKGREELYFFSLQTPEGAYEVMFSKESLCWHLKRLLGP